MIGLIFGCWDLFHVGHLRALQLASEMTDWLIIGVYSDKVIESFKGKKSIIDESERLEIIKSLRNVTGDTYLITDRPSRHDFSFVDILFVSEEWVGKEIPFKPKNFKGKIIYIPYTKEISTSIIKDRILKQALNPLGNALEELLNPPKISEEIRKAKKRGET